MTETTIQPLIADPKHQANDSLRGYRYQILHSVHAWLSLADDEILYLEGAEDFDIVSPETTTVVQVKDAQRNITLDSDLKKSMMRLTVIGNCGIIIPIGV